ncbi:MAG TPA: cytochrome P450 [Nitrososphaeraceae archaeon]|nr:cytochrome P450 [Nitrososphaeraceae archaeon]
MNIFPPSQESLNPFPFYAQMRKFHPIEYDEKNGIWGIFRYNDIQSILTDYRNFSSDIQKLVSIQQEQEIQKSRELRDHKKKRRLLRSSLLTSDPPRHTQLRRVISSAFSPNTIYKFKPRIEQICHDMIDKVIQQGHMDLINDLAYPLPVTVIAELLGIQAQDQDTFKKWADDLLGSTRGSSNNLPTDKDSEKIFARVQGEMDSYFNNIIQKRRTQKGLSSPSNDLIDNLLRAEIDGNRLSEEDILAFCSLLLLAGHVTTVNLIGNVVRSLLEHPQQLKQLLLLQNNGNSHENYDSLISSAIDETLRYRSPVQAVFRFAINDVTIGENEKEQTILRGQRMIMWIGSANHDESIFTNAEIFDINRNTTDTHLAFGHGIHFCLGSILATLEAQVVLKIILERLHNLRFANEYNKELLKPLHGVFFHGVSSMPLCFEPNCPIKK